MVKDTPIELCQADGSGGLHMTESVIGAPLAGQGFNRVFSGPVSLQKLAPVRGNRSQQLKHTASRRGAPAGKMHQLNAAATTPWQARLVAAEAARRLDRKKPASVVPSRYVAKREPPSWAAPSERKSSREAMRKGVDGGQTRSSSNPPAARRRSNSVGSVASSVGSVGSQVSQVSRLSRASQRSSRSKKQSAAERDESRARFEEEKRRQDLARIAKLGGGDGSESGGEESDGEDRGPSREQVKADAISRVASAESLARLTASAGGLGFGDALGAPNSVFEFGDGDGGVPDRAPVDVPVIAMDAVMRGMHRDFVSDSVHSGPLTHETLPSLTSARSAKSAGSGSDRASQRASQRGSQRGAGLRGLPRTLLSASDDPERRRKYKELDPDTFRMTWCDQLDHNTHKVSAHKQLVGRAATTGSGGRGPEWLQPRQASEGVFFGQQARADFFKLYKTQTAATAREGHVGPLKSARNRFIQLCNEDGIAPLPLPIGEEWKGDSSADGVINLSGRRIGDRLAAAYAEALVRMVAQGMVIKQIYMQDNALRTAHSVVPLARAARACNLLNTLDLSHNNMRGMSRHHATVVAEALSTHKSLTELNLAHCRLGDGPVHEIVELLHRNNKSLLHLNLESNDIGQKDVGHGACTALAHLLLQNNCPLETLKLGWNNIRTVHAYVLGSALSENIYLRSLDLTWNSLGDEGGEYLADALRVNTVLDHLNLTHCLIKEQGAMVVGDMLKENRFLESLVLDSNPIGRRGGRALLRAIDTQHRYGWHRHISLAHCNMTYEDAEKKLFDPARPGGTYNLNLHDPYQRMVAWELVELAWKEDGENWEDERMVNPSEPFNLDEPPSDVIWTRDDFPELGNRHEGTLHLVYKVKPQIVRFKHVLSPPMMQSIIALMRNPMNVDGGLGILKLAAIEFYFSAEYVATLISILRDSVARLEALEALCHRIVDPMNINSLIFDYLSDAEMLRLEKHIGENLFYFVNHNPTGHYELNLSKESDRVLILDKLLPINVQESAFREENGLWDTSQEGDYDNWRNAKLNGKPVDLSEDELTTGGLPDSGILTLDYVSTDTSARRASNVAPMNKETFRHFLKELAQLRTIVPPSHEEVDLKHKIASATSTCITASTGRTASTTSTTTSTATPPPRSCTTSRRRATPASTRSRRRPR